MTCRARVILSSSVVCGVLAVLSPSRAADHMDGPRATADPQADITDVFAFTSPDHPERLVLAMTVAPFASSTAKFASQVDYVFHVRRVTALRPLTLDTTALDVVCTFDDAAIQRVTCAAPGGRQATALVGQTTGGSQAAMPVFAGLRSDPSFFDRQGALAIASTGLTRWTGQNAFAGANVLAIVLEVNADAFAAPIDAGPEAGDDAGGATTTPVTVAVAAETLRRGP